MKVQITVSESKGVTPLPPAIDHMVRYNNLNWSDVIDRVKGVYNSEKSASYLVVPSEDTVDCTVFIYEPMGNSLRAASVFPQGTMASTTKKGIHFINAHMALKHVGPFIFKNFINDVGATLHWKFKMNITLPLSVSSKAYESSSDFESDVSAVQEHLNKIKKITGSPAWSDWMRQTDANYSAHSVPLNKELIKTVALAQKNLDALYEHLVNASE